MSLAPTDRGVRAALLAVCVVALALASGCADEPIPGPGVLTVTVESPNGVEGAALLKLVGSDILKITATVGRAFAEYHGDTVMVVVVDEAGGKLHFGVEVADTTRKPVATLLDVSGPDDQLRSLRGYSVDIRR